MAQGGWGSAGHSETGSVSSQLSMGIVVANSEAGGRWGGPVEP